MWARGSHSFSFFSFFSFFFFFLLLISSSLSFPFSVSFLLCLSRAVGGAAAWRGGERRPGGGCAWRGRRRPTVGRRGVGGWAAGRGGGGVGRAAGRRQCLGCLAPAAARPGAAPADGWAAWGQRLGDGLVLAEGRGSAGKEGGGGRAEEEEEGKERGSATSTRRTPGLRRLGSGVVKNGVVNRLRSSTVSLLGYLYCQGDSGGGTWRRERPLMPLCMFLRLQAPLAVVAAWLARRAARSGA